MIKQRASGRKDGYARISGLADICERPHMSTEQRKDAEAAAAGRGANVCSIAGVRKREAMHSFNYTWYVAPAHGHKYENPEIKRILIFTIINEKR